MWSQGEEIMIKVFNSGGFRQEIHTEIQKSDGRVTLKAFSRDEEAGGLVQVVRMTKFQLQELIWDLERVHDEMVDFGDIPTYADIFDLVDWGPKGACRPYDGHGYWLKGELESTVSCFKEKPEWATGVSWYNR